MINQGGSKAWGALWRGHCKGVWGNADAVKLATADVTGASVAARMEFGMEASFRVPSDEKERPVRVHEAGELCGAASVAAWMPLSPASPEESRSRGRERRRLKLRLVSALIE